MKIDIFTLFPGWFGWFLEQRHVRNALELGHSLEPVDLRATTPLKAGQVDDTPYGGGAGMVIRVDVVEAALDARYGPDRARAAGGRAGARRAPVRRCAGRRARGRGRARAAVRALRGVRRAGERAAGDRRGLDRPVRAGRRRAGGDGRVRRGDCASCRERSATRRARSRSRSARRSRGRPSTRTTRARTTGTGTRSRRSCSRETTRRCASGGSSRVAGGLGAQARLGAPSLPFRIRAAGPRQVAPLLCPASSKASSVPSCGASRSSRRATACACTSRSSRAPAAGPRCSRAS